MNEYLLLKFAHLLAFVYWLGGDLGTFLASREVINRQHSVPARQVALKIMLACDMGPKLAMPLIMPLGVQLAALGGWLAVDRSVLILLWLLCIYWFIVVLVLFLNEGKAFTTKLARADFWFRIIFASGLGLWGIYLLVASSSAPSWLAWKLLVFVAMVFCGIMIRINLAPFAPAFVELISEGPSDRVNTTLERIVGRCRPWVWAIWSGLFLNAALGLHLWT
ncbi:hypothetical protein F0M18_06110 [Pseudohalioglobus sediminis]|uniref:DUF2269 family protein n=1 Tax=Pseudohalioglobus sediminis TaxID=2606449 RepID=A0A5B0X462_9GAMM|nr:hypothetical protein [Pseudohalioglobus sediminis]KAA1193408.1 hypothetical protein F0M18_06110 [Pseudohalioglobus sediminis]